MYHDFATKCERPENSNGRPRVCTGNARRPRVLSPAASWLKIPVTQGRGTIPSEPVKILSRSPDGFANQRGQRAALREPDSDRVKVGCGSDRSAVQGLAAGHEFGLVAGAAVSDLTQFNHSNRREESAAGGRGRVHRGIRDLYQKFPLGPVWGMARERAKEARPRQVPAPGGVAGFPGGWGTAVFDSATRNEARWRSLR